MTKRITTNNLAKRLNLSARQTRRLAKDGKLPPGYSVHRPHPTAHFQILVDGPDKESNPAP